MVDYKFNTTPAEVIQLEAIYKRLDRIEGMAIVKCWRCSREITLSRSRFIIHPGLNEEVPLCYGCYSNYEDLIHNNETKLDEAQRAYLKEIRLQKK